MCVGLIGVGLTLAGGVIQGAAAAQQANANAAAYDARADQAERQANLEREKGAVEQGRVSRQARQVLAQNAANFASIGLDPSAGSAASVMESSARQVDMDLQAIQFSTETRVSNQQFEADLNRFNAGRARASAPFAFAAPIIGAGSSVFSGISSGAINIGGSRSGGTSF